MTLADTIHQDMVTAMKERATERLSTLRMVKAAFKNREIEKRAPLSDPEAQQVLTTLIKQRRESIEQFTKGNRPELAAKEAEEIKVIEAYMPQAVGEDALRAIIVAALDELRAEMRAQGQTPGPRDVGAAMKAVQAKIQAAGLRAEGKQVSELVKAELAR